ncbi:Glycosyltransferase [uncultured virus]|nr:Glycosyltransferase [uncultured virus]
MNSLVTQNRGVDIDNISLSHIYEKNRDSEQLNSPFESFNPLVTFAESIIYGYAGRSHSELFYSDNHLQSNSDSSLICLQEKSGPEESLPIFPYTFNPDIWNELNSNTNNASLAESSTPNPTTRPERSPNPIKLDSNLSESQAYLCLSTHDSNNQAFNKEDQQSFNREDTSVTLNSHYDNEMSNNEAVLFEGDAFLFEQKESQVCNSTELDSNYKISAKSTFETTADASASNLNIELRSVSDLSSRRDSNLNTLGSEEAKMLGQLNFPRAICRDIPDDNRKRYNSVSRHMPNWNYVEFNMNQQKDFIGKHFPERLALYKNYLHNEQRVHLFTYLWLYMNGGVYISQDYELLKTIEPVLIKVTDISHHSLDNQNMNQVDLYFMFDEERYISPKFLVSQPFCGFWIEAVDLMEKRKKHKYPQIREEIDRNSGRGLLTDVLEETQFKYEIIPRSQLDPYGPCETKYDKDSYLRPVSRDLNFMTYMKCQTGSTDELIYIAGSIIFVIAIMVLIALITQ